MTAARPLDFDDMDVRPLTDEDLDELPPEVGERARWTSEQWAARRQSHPQEFTSHEEIEVILAQKRIEALAAEGVDASDTSPAGRAAIRAAEERLYARAGLAHPR